mmetsp:Transcript_74306/g.187223  ORF Transcript_74306/g.187223 Transcript_74306/m.187223 type:complete len:248 (-) Transcript_74306:163-906(-)
MRLRPCGRSNRGQRPETPARARRSWRPWWTSSVCGLGNWRHNNSPGKRSRSSRLWWKHRKLHSMNKRASSQAKAPLLTTSIVTFRHSSLVGMMRKCAPVGESLLVRAPGLPAIPELVQPLGASAVPSRPDEDRVPASILAAVHSRHAQAALALTVSLRERSGNTQRSTSWGSTRALGRSSRGQGRIRRWVQGVPPAPVGPPAPEVAPRPVGLKQVPLRRQRRKECVGHRRPLGKCHEALVLLPLDLA